MSEVSEASGLHTNGDQVPQRLARNRFKRLLLANGLGAQVEAVGGPGVRPDADHDGLMLLGPGTFELIFDGELKNGGGAFVVLLVNDICVPPGRSAGADGNVRLEISTRLSGWGFLTVAARSPNDRNVIMGRCSLTARRVG